jgi:hypothetical protein
MVGAHLTKDFFELQARSTVKEKATMFFSRDCLTRLDLPGSDMV